MSQIFAPTAIFEPRRKREVDEVMYWPKNLLAEQLCHFRDALWVPEYKLKEIEDMRIKVEIINDLQMRSSAKDYDSIMDHTIRANEAYRIRKQLGRMTEPKYIDDKVA